MGGLHHLTVGLKEAEKAVRSGSAARTASV